MPINVNTEAVKVIAGEIDSEYKRIRAMFDDINTCKEALKTDWTIDGQPTQSAQTVISSIEGLLAGQNAEINTQIEYLIEILYQAVGVDYETTEEANVRIAWELEGKRITPSGSVQYKLPEYALQGNNPQNGEYSNILHLSNGGTWSVAHYNYPDSRGVKMVSCTYYTLKKLRMQGLGYPCINATGSFNGKNWYWNRDTALNLPSFEGPDAIQKLADSLTLPQENIVVSFDVNHVLLIDKIYKENDKVMISYSDMYNLLDHNKMNPQQTKTIDDFMAYYNKWNGNVIGAVVIGAGDGTNIYA